MKKCLTLIMLGVFLLNAVGFYGIFIGLQFKYAQEANSRLDNDLYAAGDAITFKIPLSIPYATDRDYERVNGEVTHEGEVYRLVKQKLFQDTLYLVCVKDKQSKKINQALTDYVKTFSDKPMNSKQSNKLDFSFIKDYLNSFVKIECHACGWLKNVKHKEFTTDFLSLYSPPIKYPPKSV